MCQMCQDPDLTRADLRAKVFAMIEKFGWMIQYVEAEPGQEPFAYTIGLTAVGLPELYVEQMTATASARLLNHAASEMVDGDLGPCDAFDGPDGRAYLVSSRVDVTALLGALDAFGARVRALELSPM